MELEHKPRFHPQRGSRKRITVQYAMFVLGFKLEEAYKEGRFIQKYKLSYRNVLARGHSKSRSFWERDGIEYLLNDAQQKYKAACKQHHPDVGGSTEKMMEINEAWEFIQHVFAKRGYRLS